jgi:hypothetical protein
VLFDQKFDESKSPGLLSQAWTGVFGGPVIWMKLPRLPKKLRVMVGWTLDLFFARDIEQMLTIRDVLAASSACRRKIVLKILD